MYILKTHLLIHTFRRNKRFNEWGKLSLHIKRHLMIPCKWKQEFIISSDITHLFSENQDSDVWEDDYRVAMVLLWAIFLNRKDVAKICWLKCKNFLCKKLYYDTCKMKYHIFFLPFYPLECKSHFLTTFCRLSVYISECVFKKKHCLALWRSIFVHLMPVVRPSIYLPLFVCPSVCTLFQLLTTSLDNNKKNNSKGKNNVFRWIRKQMDIMNNPN